MAQYYLIKQTVNGEIVDISQVDIAEAVVPISGGTFSGDVNATTLSAGTINSDNFYGNASGLTNIYLSNTIGQLPLSSLTNSFIDNAIIVGKSGLTNFSSVKSAVDSINDASATNRYAIFVNPGIYIEDTITLKEYIDIKAISYNSVVIEVDSTNKDVINITGNTTLEGLILRGSTDNGKALFNMSSNLGIGKTCTIKDCTAGNTNIIFKSNLSSGEFGTVAFDTITGSFANTFKTGFDISGDGYSVISIADTKNSVSNVIDDYIHIRGANNKIILTNFGVLVQPLLGGALTNFIRCSDGAFVESVSVAVENATNGINNENIGAGCKLELKDCNIVNSTMDINIQNSATTGSFFGTAEYVKTYINPLSSFYIYNKDANVIKVSTKGGDFSSIAAAINSITGSSEDNAYEILVAAGTYIEPLIDLSNKPYVSIVGYTINATVIQPDDINHDVIKIGANNEISFLTIASAGTGYAGIMSSDSGDYFQLHKVTISDCDTCIKVYSSSVDTYGYLEYVDFGGVMRYGLNIESTGGYKTFLNAENFYIFPSNSGSTSVFITGLNSDLVCNSSGIYGVENIGDTSLGNIGIECQNGAKIELTSTNIGFFDTAIKNNNTGSGCTIDLIGCILNDNDSYDIQILNPFTTGGMIGTATLNKIFVEENSTFTPMFTNKATGGAVIVGDIYNGPSVNEVVEVSTFIENLGVGLISGGELSSGGTFTVSVTAGIGYVYDSGILKKITWDNDSIVIPSASTNYIYYDSTSILQYFSSKPNNLTNIILGLARTSESEIEFMIENSTSAAQSSNKSDEMLRNVFGALYETGSNVVESITPLQIDISNGIYYYGSHKYEPSGMSAATFDRLYLSGIGTFSAETNQNIIPNDKYNTNYTLTGISSGYFVKHSLYLAGDGDTEKYMMVYATAQYSGETDATVAGVPLPPEYFNKNGVVLIASIITQEGNPNIVKIISERPFPISQASIASSSNYHPDLLGLTEGNAGHTQFMMLNGNTQMVGDFNLGGHNIISAGTVNGITVESHASRHLPNGADPLATAVPVNIGISNEVGIQNSLARSDHQHAHGSLSGGNAHNVATNSVAGFMSDLDKSYLDSLSDLLSTKANVSGQTFTEGIFAPFISATTLSASTIISGSTNLYDIFDVKGSEDITRVQPGSNIETGGTANNPTINLVDSPQVVDFTAIGDTNLQTVSATTIILDTKNLYDIFDVKGSEDITRVQPGSNITTGGTANNPVVNLISSPSVNNLTASGNTHLQTISATTIVSGSTNLYNIFALAGSDIDVIIGIQPGTNTYTGGTGNNPTVNISSATLNNLTVTGTTTATTINTDNVYFNTGTTAGSFAPGKLYYDLEWQTLSLNAGRDLNLQVGEEDWVRVYNNSGVKISNGKAVYVTGAWTSSTPAVATVSLANSSGSTSWRVLGLATQDIENGQYGMITSRGYINNLNTSLWSAGTELYVSDTISGDLIGSLPSPGSYKVRVGRTIVSDSFTGIVNVKIYTEGKLGDLADVNLVITPPTVDQVLKFNGTEWVNGNAVTSSAANGIDFFDASPIIEDVGTGPQNANVIATLSKTPVTTTEVAYTKTTSGVANTAALARAFLYNTPLNRTKLDAGVWTFVGYAGVNSVGNGRVNTLYKNIYRVIETGGTLSITGSGTSRGVVLVGAGSGIFQSGDAVAAGGLALTNCGYVQTPNGLFEITSYANASSVTITTLSTYTNETNVPSGSWKLWRKLFGAISPAVTSISPNVQTLSYTSAQGEFVLNTTDKLGSINLVSNTTNNSTIFTLYYDGTLRNTYVKSPLITLHNNLAGLYGSANYYHLNDAQYGALTTGGTASLYHLHDDKYLQLAGGTLIGTLVAPTISTTTLSASTIYSGSTNLYNIFSNTKIQPGSNIVTGGTINNPTVNLVNSPSVNNFIASGNTSLTIVSATTIISGSTNLYDIFATSASGEANTASNIGSGYGLYAQKVGADLRFKTLVAGNNITISSSSTEVTIASTSSGVSNRITGTTTTTDTTVTTAATISGLSTGASIIQAYIIANGDNGHYGQWKRTVAVLYSGNTMDVKWVNSDMDYQMGNALNPNSVMFSSTSPNLYLYISGVTGTNIIWKTSYEIIL